MTPSPVSDRSQAATDMLAALYPAPLTVRLGSANRAAVKASWLALPDVHNPRLLVTTGSSRAAVSTLRRQMTGQRSRTRLARSALSLGVGTGVPRLVPRLRIVVTGPGDAASIEDPLKEVLGVDHVCLTLPIGPARANRKPVLQVTDPAGHVLAYAKVGFNDLTRRLVEHESATLERLSGSTFETIQPPRVLATVHWRDLTVVVMEPLEIPARRLRGSAARDRLISVTRDIATLAAGPSLPWGEHPHRTALDEGVAQCGQVADRVHAQLAHLDGDVTVSDASWHGDLNSGNIALVEGPCPVWDWERFESAVPLGFDLLHHDLHHSITVEHQSALAAAQSLLLTSRTALEPLGVSAAAADITARSYLLTLAERYLADRQDDAGSSLGRVHHWLLPALEGHSQRTSKIT